MVLFDILYAATLYTLLIFNFMYLLQDSSSKIIITASHNFSWVFFVHCKNRN